MTEFAPRTFEEMIAAGRFDLVRPGVNPTAFPLDSEKYDDRFLQLFGFTGPMDIQKALTKVTDSSLRHAVPEQLLAYVASHPIVRPDYHDYDAIVALGWVGLDLRKPPCVMRVCYREGTRLLETRPYAGLLQTNERILISHPD
jgi:hypothetical protein